MNILVASIQPPWPLDSGGKVALYSSLDCLRSDHRFTFIYPVFQRQAFSEVTSVQAQLPHVKIRAVYCGPSDTIAHQSSRFVRSVKWSVRQYREWRHRPPTASVVEIDESQAPKYPFYPLPQAFLQALAEELAMGTDLVQCEFVEMLSLGPWLPSGIPKIFIHHQLHFVYASRFAQARSVSAYSRYLAQIMRLQEEGYLRKFDGVVVFSEEDKRALSEMLPSGKVHVSPFPIPITPVIAEGDQSDPCFSFIGTEQHFPNRDALDWLTAEIWPEIKGQEPGARLKVVGHWSEGSRALYSKPGIEFTGYVDNLANAIRGTVLLVPLRIGSGIRVKLLDAMVQCVPAVSTSIGCEGIPATDNLDILIRDRAPEFAAAAVELLNDPERRRQIARSARNLVAQIYSPEQVRKRRNEIYGSVMEEVTRLQGAKYGVANP